MERLTEDEQVEELTALLHNAAAGMVGMEPLEPEVPEDNPFRVAARTVIEINREALDRLA